MNNTYFLPVLFILTACGGTAPNTDADAADDAMATTDAADAAPKSAAVEAEPPPQPITDVTREQLNSILEKGPAHILAMVQTDSVKEGGKFIGFKIVSFRVDAPSILGVQPDDIVKKVNGLSIERPEQFLTVFEKLKTAAEITFVVMRDGTEMTLSTPIQ
ncbi:MAG: hypothetical protein JXX29_11365 [Deltaproteobacteria bacterium]|nr:hypothetical protein [Deltaproteobacteria bacterium]MBN2672270.1 hypothetical protein [Deltaproteobacteria bacterium]